MWRRVLSSPSFSSLLSPHLSSSSLPSSFLWSRYQSNETKGENILKTVKDAIAQTNYRKAEELLNGLIAMNQETTQSAQAHLWLGYLYQQNQKTEEATSYYAKGLQSLPESSPDHGWGLMNYAECLSSIGKNEEALDVAQKSLGFVERHLGSVDVAASLLNLSTYFEMNGQRKEAIEAAERALDSFSSTLGSKNSYSTGAYHNLCQLLLKNGETEKLEKIQEQWNEGQKTESDQEWEFPQLSSDLFESFNRPNKAFDPTGFIRTKEIADLQIKSFLEQWKTSNDLSPQEEKLFREATSNQRLFEIPSQLEKFHVIDQALTTGQLSAEQERLLHLQEKEKESLTQETIVETQDDDFGWLDDEADFDEEKANSNEDGSESGTDYESDSENEEESENEYESEDEEESENEYESEDEDEDEGENEDEEEDEENEQDAEYLDEDDENFEYLDEEEEEKEKDK